MPSKVSDSLFAVYPTHRKYTLQIVLFLSHAYFSLIVMHYDPQYPKIPTAAVTVEDAEMMARMVASSDSSCCNFLSYHNSINEETH